MRGPSRPCRKPGCGSLCRDGTGYCEAHTDQATGWNRGDRGSAYERGYGASWRAIRKQVMRRDKALCQPCKSLGRYTPASEVDHIVPKSRGGDDQLGNLQSICSACHSAKTVRERGRGV